MVAASVLGEYSFEFVLRIWDVGTGIIVEEMQTEARSTVIWAGDGLYVRPIWNEVMVWGVGSGVERDADWVIRTGRGDRSLHWD